MHRIGPAGDVVSTLRLTFARFVAAAGFWGAVVLGLGAVPLLVVTPLRIDVLAALIVIDILCLVVGHRYEPTPSGRLAGRDDPNSEVAG